MDGDPLTFVAKRKGVRSDSGLARNASRKLGRHVRPRRGLTVRLGSGTDQAAAVTLPAAAVRALQTALDEIAKGRAIRVLPVQTELTLAETAEVLGVSLSFLKAEVASGRLACRRTGRVRSIGVAEIANYRARTTRQRRRALGALTAMSQRLKLGY